MSAKATKQRGGDPDVKDKPHHENPSSPKERALEQGLEESMAGSDPISATQPSHSKHDTKSA